jgi:putative FmdB family regulatory protein|tara:strand:- start:1798 stop:2001 length:204 start_codon:yes stop_codon:yes gene_type:complete
MPIYEYYCERCDCTVETLQKYDDPPPECPTHRHEKDVECGLKRAISKSSFKLKGSGWAKDGYSTSKK